MTRVVSLLCALSHRRRLPSLSDPVGWAHTAMDSRSAKGFLPSMRITERRFGRTTGQQAIRPTARLRPTPTGLCSGRTVMAKAVSA